MEFEFGRMVAKIEMDLLLGLKTCATEVSSRARAKGTDLRIRQLPRRSNEAKDVEFRHLFVFYTTLWQIYLTKEGCETQKVVDLSTFAKCKSS